MFSLPRGVPLIIGVPAMKDSLPDFLGRLAQSRFTGYARYSFTEALAVLLFSDGALISLVVSRGEARQAGLEALTRLCELAITEEGTVDVYRLSVELTTALHALLHGEALLSGQEVKHLDIQAVTAQLKAKRFNGCIRVYTANRTSLVFYRDGVGFGFFHDGSEGMETTATDSQKIANLPGARLDVLSTRPADQLQALDLLEVVNLPRLWDGTVRARQAEYLKLQAHADEATRARLEIRLARAEEQWRRTAAELLGSMGRSLVDKELRDRGGHGCLLKPAELEAVLAGVERGARLVSGSTKARALVERLRGELSSHLNGAVP
jgi:hypothetical protein